MSEQKNYQDLPSFLLGESMGGAIALRIHFKQPNAWDGAALIAPLCKVYLLELKLKLELFEYLIHMQVE